MFYTGISLPVEIQSTTVAESDENLITKVPFKIEAVKAIETEQDAEAIELLARIAQETTDDTKIVTPAPPTEDDLKALMQATIDATERAEAFLENTSYDRFACTEKLKVNGEYREVKLHCLGGTSSGKLLVVMISRDSRTYGLVIDATCVPMTLTEIYKEFGEQEIRDIGREIEKRMLKWDLELSGFTS